MSGWTVRLSDLLEVYQLRHARLMGCNILFRNLSLFVSVVELELSSPCY